jgi:hypothetical protein
VFKVPGDDGRYPWEGKVEESQLAIVDGIHLNQGVRERVEEVVHKEKGLHNGTVDSV